MSLYDDIEMEKTSASGWASGIKMMPNQKAFKKATGAAVRGVCFLFMFVSKF